MLSSMPPSLLVRTARRDAELTQAQLAERLGTTQSVIARLERPDANPTLATLERALDAAGYELELRAVRRARPAIDETQILERLRWTPVERLAALTASNRNIGALVRAARRSDDAGA
jgi:transcriptional regulator with XRE-family HTH domain